MNTMNTWYQTSSRKTPSRKRPCSRVQEHEDKEDLAQQVNKMDGRPLGMPDPRARRTEPKDKCHRWHSDMFLRFNQLRKDCRLSINQSKHTQGTLNKKQADTNTNTTHSEKTGPCMTLRTWLVLVSLYNYTAAKIREPQFWRTRRERARTKEENKRKTRRASILCRVFLTHALI